MLQRFGCVHQMFWNMWSGFSYKSGFRIWHGYPVWISVGRNTGFSWRSSLFFWLDFCYLGDKPWIWDSRDLTAFSTFNANAIPSNSAECGNSVIYRTNQCGVIWSWIKYGKDFSIWNGRIVYRSMAFPSASGTSGLTAPRAQGLFLCQNSRCQKTLECGEKGL